MNPKTHYFVEILEKIGTPLLQSVIASSSPDSDGGDVDQAQALAQLLSGTVQTSIAMSSGFNFVDMPDQGDSVRVALAALAAPLVAAQYARNSAVPEQAELTKMVSVLDSVLTFAENFKPSDENTQRLADLKASGKPVDAPQVDVQYIQAFLPVVQAVSGFSFGQPEKKLAMDIAGRLVKRSAEFREQQFSAVVDADEQKSIELVIVQAMAQLYAQCHQSVMVKLSSMADASGDVPSVDSVWEEFDMRASILEVMMQNIMPKGIEAAVAAPVPPLSAPSSSVEDPVVEAPPVVAEEAAPVTVEAEQPAAPAIFQTPPAIEPEEVLEAPPETPSIFSAPADTVAPAAPDVPPADAVIETESMPEIPADIAPEAPPPAADALPVNPMAMFAAPKAEDTSEAAVIDNSQDTAAPKTATPDGSDENEGEGEKSGDSSNPMSFFKSE